MKIFGLDLQQYEAEKEPDFRVRDKLKTVTIPLKGGFGSSLSPGVEVGDEVEAGEIIARDDDSISTPAIASLAGQVIEIVELDSYHEETADKLEAKVAGIKIKVSSKQDVRGDGIEWEKEKPRNLRELLYLAGLTSFGQTGVPTEFNSSIFSPGKVEHVLINGIKTEPFVHHVIDYGEEFPHYKTGLEILARTFPKSQIHFVLDKKIQEKLGQLSSSQRIKVHSVENESYMSKSKMVAREILEEEKLDEGGYLLDHGLLALPEVFPLATYRAVVKGVPFIRGRLSLSGPDTEDLVVETPIGAPIKYALGKDTMNKAEELTIMGGPLSGNKLENSDLPVSKNMDSLVQLPKPQGSQILAWLHPGLRKNSYTNAFFSALAPNRQKVADSGLHGEERPCVYCGWCSDVCPVDILPYQILKTYNHDKVDEVNRLQPQRCVDCGLCSYVCPSKLPLSETVKQAKREQPGGNHNYVEYEEDEEGLISVIAGEDEKGRGEESE
ncbi:4Fe-4S dicluster domain-containing protein [Candidatus Bipolaricaulota bacterium]|nr:4Fe-4S dicluster domain-containing protein [Candidatus Bipolaricaulota bacterium]